MPTVVAHCDTNLDHTTAGEPAHAMFTRLAAGIDVHDLGFEMAIRSRVLERIC